MIRIFSYLAHPPSARHDQSYRSWLIMFSLKGYSFLYQKWAKNFIRYYSYFSLANMATYGCQISYLWGMKGFVYLDWRPPQQQMALNLELVVSNQLFSVFLDTYKWFKISTPGVRRWHMWQLDGRYSEWSSARDDQSCRYLHSALCMAVNEVSEYVFYFKAQCVLLNSTRKISRPLCRGNVVFCVSEDWKYESCLGIFFFLSHLMHGLFFPTYNEP